ncbi:hypothetical protein F4802DRAFT_368146 [Xylaria palmicola]|nr:hypothetical protein F4802DRAFT_368146 [Xylaria palmicola]
MRACTGDHATILIVANGVSSLIPGLISGSALHRPYDMFRCRLAPAIRAPREDPIQMKVTGLKRRSPGRKCALYVFAAITAVTTQAASAERPEDGGYQIRSVDGGSRSQLGIFDTRRDPRAYPTSTISSEVPGPARVCLVLVLEFRLEFRIASSRMLCPWISYQALNMTDCWLGWWLW